MKVTRTATYTITIDEPCAYKLSAAIGKVLNAVKQPSISAPVYVELANKGYIDTLLALKLALFNEGVEL